MKLTRRKNIGIIVAVLLLASPALLITLPTASAHSPPWQIPTWCFCIDTNSVTGVNQPVNIVFWLNAFPPTAQGQYGDRWNFNVVITKPDGTTDSFGPIKSDPVGTGYLTYIPLQTGNYSVVAKFGGQTLTGEPAPPAWYLGQNVYIGDIYQPSQSDAATFTVQTQQIQGWQEPPLPTGYWTVPVNSMNRGWASIVSNWLGGAAQNVGPTASFNYGQAPESAHVLWVTPLWAGGIMDARLGAMNYETVHYQGLSFNPIILSGKIFYNVGYEPSEGWYALDLYTGKVDFFHNTTGPVTGETGTQALAGTAFDSLGTIGGESLAFGQIYNYYSPNQIGGFPYLWSTTDPSLANTWRMYDAFSGNYICSITNVTQTVKTPDGRIVTTGGTGTAVYGQDGSILRYNIVNLGTTASPQDFLQVWNSSLAISYRIVYPTNQYWMWRPYLNYTFGGQYGFSQNVSIPAVQGSILAVREGKYVIGGTAGKNNGTFTMQGNFWTLNLDPSQGAIGTLLSNITYTPPTEVFPDIVSTATAYFGQGKMSSPIIDPEDNIFLFNEPVQRTWWGFSLSSGRLLWQSQPEDQWNYYGMGYDIYNGMLLSYGSGQTGSQCVAYNITTGQVMWTWIPAQVGFESPYGTFPLDMGCIAGGNIYFYTRDHHQDTLLPRGSAIWCINASSGKLVWKIASWGSGVSEADGYLVGWNTYDNQIYCYGKGPSATTVSIQDDVVTQGNTVFIKGSVTDQSQGAKDLVTSGKLSSIPAVSDADQEAWMEYLYMQQAFPQNAQGVQVHLTAFDPNNNTEDIGYATTDIGGSFGLSWTPPVPGTYHVTATFLGTNSYGNSYATTSFVVVAAKATAAASPVVTPAPTQTQTAVPTTTPTPTIAASPSPVVASPTSPAPTAMYVATAATIIIILAVAAAFILRKRK